MSWLGAGFENPILVLPYPSPSDEAVDVLKMVDELRAREQLCDVTLTVKGQKLHANRIFLATASPYFYAMFVSGMRETYDREVEIGGVDFKSLKAVVDAIYTRTISIDVLNVQDLLMTASLLRVVFVTDRCCAFLLHHLDPDNCLGISMFMTTYGCLHAAMYVDDYILQHFVKVSQTDEFLLYPIKLLLPLLRRNSLNVSHEEQVLDAVIRWMNASDDNLFTGLQPPQCDAVSNCLCDTENQPRQPLFLRSKLQDASTAAADAEVLPTGNATSPGTDQSSVPRAQSSPSSEKSSPASGRNSRSLSVSDSTVGGAAAGGNVAAAAAAPSDAAAAASNSRGNRSGGDPLAAGGDGGATASHVASPQAWSATDSSSVHPPAAVAADRRTPRSQLAWWQSDGVLTPLRRRREDARDDDDDNDKESGVSARQMGQSLDVPRGQAVGSSPRLSMNTAPAEPRSVHAGDLLRCVRLPHLRLSTLLPLPYSVPELEKSAACRELIDKAKTFLLHPEGKSLREQRQCLSMARPRLSERGYVFTIGGKKSSDQVSRSVEIYDSRANVWRRGPQLTIPRQQLGVAYLGECIYVIGGSDGTVRLSSVHCYNLRTHQWFARDSLASPRSGVGVGVLGPTMYAVGGYDGHMCLESVERYDPLLDKWSFVAPMNHRRSFPGVAALAGRIVVIGGNDGSTFLSVAEVYEPHWDRWLSIPDMCRPRAGIGAASLHGYLYVCGGNDGTSRLDSVERYDLATNTWEEMQPMKAARDGACLAALGDSLIALGGINGPAYLDSVEEYNPESNEWKYLAKMKVCRVAGGVAVVPSFEMMASEDSIHTWNAITAEGAAATSHVLSPADRNY